MSIHSDIQPLRSVAVKHAADAFLSPDFLAGQWQRLNYSECPDFEAAVSEYDAFLALLSGLGVQLLAMPREPALTIDAMYVRDASVVFEDGAIICSMGKEDRRGEPFDQESFFLDNDVPVVGRIEGDGRLEGGDVAWIDERTLAVGRGYRTNDEGIAQLRQILGDRVESVEVVQLPHWRGADDVFHLMSVFSPVDVDLAVVYSPLLPVSFRELLLARDYDLVEVPHEELDSLGCNVLAVAPRVVVTVAGNPRTRELLERSGATVHEISGSNICRPGGGGPTCLTRPIVRSVS